MKIIKLLFFSLLFFLCFNLKAQIENIIRIGYQKNIELWAPYAIIDQNYIKSGGKVESNSSSAYAQCTIFNHDTWNFLAGISFKTMNYIAANRITSSKYYSGSTLVNYTYKDPLDLVSKSYSFGISAEFNYQLFQTRIVRGQIGVNLELYFLESFRAKYISKDAEGSLGKTIPIPDVGTIPKMFILSSSNISVFYRTTFNGSPYLSPSLKLGIGTNLYSDWNQFRKYTWLAIGLEIGFGKRKMKTENQSTTNHI